MRHPRGRSQKQERTGVQRPRAIDAERVARRRRRRCPREAAGYLPPLPQNILHLILLIISSIILIIIFDKFRIPAALLSGTLFASGFLQISEIASYQFPPNIIDYCLLILGASVGCRFADKTFGEIARNALHSFVATFLLVVLGLLAALAASLIIDKNFFTLLLSYCPGGIYEVAVIAIFFDLDPEFVSFHHIIRLLMILFIVPLMLKIIEKKNLI